MSNKIEIDVLSAVQDFYPGISDDDAQLITDEIINNWDFSEIYNQIQDDIKWYADSHDIELEGHEITEITEKDYV